MAFVVLVAGGGLIAEENPFRDSRTGRFLTGNSGGGRPPGSRNKLSEAFLGDLLSDWELHGTQAIEAARVSKPEVYIRVIASLLPREASVEINPLSELSDDELDARIKSLSKILAAFEDKD